MRVAIISYNKELKEAFRIRKEVFIKEQGVNETDEFDVFDQLNGNVNHVLLFINNEPVGTGRIRFIDDYGKIERICLLKSHRKKGGGKAIIRELEQIALENNKKRVILHGQVQASGFYQRLGYQTASEPFIEDGISHFLMEKQLLDVARRS